jgi:hypothetical protein
VLKAMKSNSCQTPGVEGELEGDAGLAEARGVGEGLVAEDVELADLDVGGRQPGGLGDAGRGAGVLGGGAWHREQAAPDDCAGEAELFGC